MSDVHSFHASNENPGVFVAYGGTVSEVLVELAALLDKHKLEDNGLIAINYNEWDGEHSITAVVSFG